MRERLCGTCGRTLPDDKENFYQSKWLRGGTWDMCKDCIKESQRDSMLRREYGLTKDAWQQLFDKQQGRCAICGKHQSEFKQRLNTDHNHKTGKVRGLVCPYCNHLIGVYEENFYGRKEKIADYLRGKYE